MRLSATLKVGGQGRMFDLAVTLNYTDRGLGKYRLSVSTEDLISQLQKVIRAGSIGQRFGSRKQGEPGNEAATEDRQTEGLVVWMGQRFQENEA